MSGSADISATATVINPVGFTTQSGSDELVVRYPGGSSVLVTVTDVNGSEISSGLYEATHCDYVTRARTPQSRRLALTALELEDPPNSLVITVIYTEN